MPHEIRPQDMFLTRRRFLERCGMGFGGLALGGLLGAQGGASTAAAATTAHMRGPHFPGRAKRVIHLFMNGGPSHIDTFDPKPELDRWDGRELPMDNLRTERPTGAGMKSPFSFSQHGQSGMKISELFPHIAKHADELCLIRSMQADVPNHEPSLMLMNCGDARLPRPSMGSWITYGLGSENESLPAYVALCPGGMPIKQADNWRSAFLPGSYQGTYLDTRHRDIERLIENIRHPSMETARQQRQFELLQNLNRRHLLERERDGQLETRIHGFELAYRMQAEATDAFDIDREPESVREMYGPGDFARQCLMARRMMERGVRFAQLWFGAGQPWDHHDDISQHANLARQCDQAIGALLTDLKQRGMLDDTLVIWGGEFGRTPTVELPQAGSNQGRMLGRDHNHYGFSMWMAGGGVKGGHVHGSTDEFGFRAVENPMHVHDLHATILHLLGFDHERFTFNYSGRDFRLTDVHGNVVHDLIA